MKKSLLSMLFAALALVVTFNAFAVDEAEMDSIKAACQEEAKDAQYPEEFVQECVELKLQALKEEQGGGATEKEPS